MDGIVVRNNLSSKEYDAFPSNVSGCVNGLECNLSDFLETLDFPSLSINSHSSSDCVANKDNPSLFDKSCNDNQQKIRLCKTETVNLCGNGTSGRDPTDSLNFDLSDINSDSMKFKGVTECDGCGGLSDLLSSSSENSSNKSSSLISDSKFNLSDILVGKAEITAASKESIAKKEASCCDSVFSLSDILSSISLEDDRQQRSDSSKKSSFEISDEGLSLDDFKIYSDESPVVKNNSSEKDQENLSDILSSLDFTSIDSNASHKDKKFDKRNLNLPNNSTHDQATITQFNIEDLMKDLNIESNDKLYPLRNKQQQGFSFFCDSSENTLSFSEMLNNRKDPSKHEEYSVSGDSGISMMDFLNSLDNTKESSSTDDSDDPSSPFSSTLEEEEELQAIDLNSCIKSEDKLTLDPSPKKELCDTPEPLKAPEHADILPLPLQHSVVPTSSRKGMKKSLFAKSLSCKPKTDPNLLCKVASIKADLFNRVFGRPVWTDAPRKNPLPEFAKYSDTPTVPHAGRKSYDRSGFSFVC